MTAEPTLFLIANPTHAAPSRRKEALALAIGALLYLGICASVAPTWVALTGLLIHGLWWKNLNPVWCLPLMVVPYLLSPAVESLPGRLVLVAITTGLVAIACTTKKKESGPKRNEINPYLFVFHTAVIMGMIVGINTVTRHHNLATSSFDLGNLDNIIFNLTYGLSQASPMERNNPAISHFQVHFSPMLILLTPIYKLAPSAETLLWMQAAL